MGDDSEVRLGRDGVRRGWLLAAASGASAVLIVVTAAIGWWPLTVAAQVSYPVLALTASLVWLLTRRGADAVVPTTEHLSVEGRAGPHHTGPGATSSRSARRRPPGWSPTWRRV